MMNIYKYLVEKLVINKNLKKSSLYKYKNLYGEGEIKLFKECDVYTLNSYGHKNEKIEDQDIHNFVNKYFDDNENVFVILEDYKNGRVIKRNLNDSTLNKIFSTKVFDRIIKIMRYGRGYFIKKLSDDQLVLIIKDYLKNGNIKHCKYIFKIQ